MASEWSGGGTNAKGEEFALSNNPNGASNVVHRFFISRAPFVLIKGKNHFHPRRRIKPLLDEFFIESLKLFAILGSGEVNG
ncbi:MAG: hypothetical protein AB1345_01320 [Chloroflexota bacterium]